MFAYQRGGFDPGGEAGAFTDEKILKTYDNRQRRMKTQSCLKQKSMKLKKRRNSGQWHSPTYPAFQTSRFNELKARTTEKQWTVALSDIHWPRIEAVAEFRLRTGHDCFPLMSLDYVPNTIAYKHLHRLGVYTQLTCTPSQIGSIHSTHMDLHRLGVYTQPTCPLHRLGVYTQPICPFTDWEYTLNPHALWIGRATQPPLHRLRVYTQPTCPQCNLHEEMEKNNLIRCPALKTMTDSQRN
ncbi:unnamed protein product [Rodentolepis nana]|uniref:Reverse transcriptase zinc-binding domain-containing protein n=1 Tax=Rodentolepis nana TaxID=102285 RepID=A0A0R3TLQ9_RODNA|nr:unnamed protein product [Rodentolepis nana]